MPAGGKINRREHLRSKVGSPNAKSNTDEKSPKKENNRSNNPGFRYLEQLKERNALLKGTAAKDALVKADGDKSKNTKTPVIKISPLKKSNENETASKTTLRKTNTLRSTRAKADAAVMQEDVILNAMEIEQDAKVVKATLKKSSTIRGTRERHIVAEETSNDMDVDIDTNSTTKEDISSLKPTVKKASTIRSTREKKEESTSNVIDVAIATEVKSSLKKIVSQRNTRNKTDVVIEPPTVVSPIKEIVTKSRIPKNIETPKKTVAKQLEKEDDVVVERLSPRKSRSEAVNTPRVRSTPSKSRVPKSIVTADRMNVVHESDNIEVHMEIDDNIEKMSLAQKRTGRQSTKIVKSGTPFVVEKDDKPEPTTDVTKIPGREMLENLKKRKSQMLSQNVESVRSTVPDDQATSKIIEGYTRILEETVTGKSAADTRKRISYIETVEEKPVQSRKPKPTYDSPKVPGFSLIEEMRSRKSAVVSSARAPAPQCPPAPAPVVHQPFYSPAVTRPTVTMTMTSRPPVRLPPPESPRVSSTQPPSIFRTPTSVLARSSNNKRPMSCLSDDDDDGQKERGAIGGGGQEPRGKVARTDEKVSRRQSVTFNNQVEVKEIRGNSFNDESSSGSVEDHHQQQQGDLAALEERVRRDLERTRSDLATRRLGQNRHNVFSRGNTPSVTVPSSSVTGVPRVSELSTYLAQKRRAQTGTTGTPVGFSFTNQPPSTSFSNVGVTPRFTAQSTADQNRLKNTVANAMVVDSDDSMKNDISDDEMDDEQRNKNDKCTLI